MSATNDLREQIGEEADFITDSIRQPVRGVSLFYALYYLVEIEGYEEARFDFKQIVDEYHRAFWWYGIYTILRESAALYDRYFIYGHTVDRYSQSRLVNINRDPFGETIEEQVAPSDMLPHVVSLVDREQVAEMGYDEDVITDTVRDLFLDAHVFHRVTANEGKAAVTGLFGAAEDLLVPGLMEDPKPVIVAINQVFANSSTVLDYIGAQPTPEGWGDEEVTSMGKNARIQLFQASGWISNQWNGPGWTGITRHLLRRDELSKTAWVDQSWSIEHNNNVWMDKLGVRDSERDVIADVEGRTNLGTVADVKLFAVVEDLLDAARDGDMETVFDYAVQYSRDIDINLRRARRVVDL